MNLDTVTLIATVPAIVALVNLAKKFGIRNEWSMLLALILGAGLSLSDYFFSAAGWYSSLTSGILLGLGAAGLYDVTNKEPTGVTVVTTGSTLVESSEPLVEEEEYLARHGLVQGKPWPENWPPSAE